MSRHWFSPRDASLPSFGSRRARFPAVVGTMKALRLPIRASAVAYGFAPAVHGFLLLRVRRSAPGRPEVPPRPGPCGTGCPTSRPSSVDANGISQVFRRSIPCLCSVPRPRSNRRALAITVASMLPPLCAQRRLRRWLISGLTGAASPPAVLRFAFRVAAHAQGSLPAGRLGLCRVGVEPTGPLRKVSARVHDHPPPLLS